MIPFIGSFVFLLGGLVTPNGPLRLAEWAAAAMLLNIGLLAIAVRNDRENWGYKWYAVAAGCLVPFYLIINAVFFPGITSASLINTNLLLSAPFSLLYSFPMYGLAALLLSFAFHGNREGMRGGMRPQIAETLPAIDLVSSCISVLFMLQWVTYAYPDSPFSFPINVLLRGFSFFPFVAGYRLRQAPRVGALWVVILALSLVLAILSGNRGLGFFPAVHFCIGVLLSRRHRMVYGAGMAVAFIGALYLGGLSAVMREESGGRVSVFELDVGEALSAAPRLAKELASEKMESAGATNPAGLGAARLVPWTMVVVPNLAGHGVPYRGTAELQEDVLTLFSLKWLTPYTHIGMFRPVVYARDYGFSVWVEGERDYTTTVPFGVMVDGWSRGGFIVAFFYISSIMLLTVLVERLNTFLNRRYPVTRVLCLAVIWGLPFFLFTTYGIIWTARQFVLQYVFIFIIGRAMEFLIAQFVPSLMQHRVIRRPLPPPPIGRQLRAPNPSNVG